MIDFIRRFHNLIFRLVITSVVIGFYIVDASTILDPLGESINVNIFTLLWFIFVLEILSRFLPSHNIGVSKVFASSFVELAYDKASIRKEQVADSVRAFLMFIIYIIATMIVTVLYTMGIIDKGVVVIIVLSYWTLSEVFVQLFCPISYLFFGKKCCNKCRFYSWDYMLMFTPLLFIGSVYTYIVVILSVILVIFWEISYIRHPERFYDMSNESLKCVNCTNKNCKYKNTFNGILDKILGFFKRNRDTKP